MVQVTKRPQEDQKGVAGGARKACKFGSAEPQQLEEPELPPPPALRAPSVGLPEAPSVELPEPVMAAELPSLDTLGCTKCSWRADGCAQCKDQGYRERRLARFQKKGKTKGQAKGQTSGHATTKAAAKGRGRGRGQTRQADH